MILGLILGIATSAWLAVAAHEHELEPALPGPWVTASFGIAVLCVGWLLTQISPKLTVGLVGGALPGAAYAATALAADGSQQLAYAWSSVPVALGWIAIAIGFSTPSGRSRSWSTRRRTASRVPRARTRVGPRTH